MATIGQAQTLKKAVEKIPAYAWVVLSIPWIVVVLGAILNFAIGVMLPSMREELGFGAAQSGILSSISWFLTAILTIPVTAVINRYGPKVIMTIILFCVAVMILLQGISSSFPMLLVTRAVGLGMVVGITPALTLLKQQWVPLSRMTTVNGVEAFTQPAGQVLATALVPFLLIWFAGWRTTFYALAGITLVLAVAWVFLGKEKDSSDSKAEEKKEQKGQSALLVAARHKPIWLLALGWPGTTLVWIAFFTFWPTFAVENLGVPMTQAGLILSLLPVGSMIASLVSPVICERLGVEKPMIWIWGFILPFCYFAMLITSNTVLLGIASFLAGFGAFAFVPPGFSLPFKLPGIKPNEVAMGMGIVISIITIGGGLGPLVSGAIYEATGDLYRALAICCLSPLTLGIFGLFLPERGRLAMEREAQSAS